MKKLVFVTDSLKSGGAERVMSILANNLTIYGFDITIISKSHEPSFYSLRSEVKLYHPKTKIIYKNKIVTLFTRFILYHEIYMFLKTEKPYIVVSFGTSTNGAIILICKMIGLQVIASEHNNFKLKINSFPYWIIKRWIYPLADFITVLTERDKKEYYGKFMKNVVVMPNPLPLEPTNKVNSWQREKIILSVGNLSRWKQKGFDYMLEIFSQIGPKYPEWKLLIAGSGDPTYLIGRIQKLELGNQVSLLGEVRDIQILMQRSSIFSLPSRWEGLPMVLIEAMSQGMSCIAFDCFTGPGELIRNRFDGILVEDQHIDQFIDGLSELIENQDLRLSLGTCAVETSKNYLPEIIVKKWYTLIENPFSIHE